MNMRNLAAILVAIMVLTCGCVDKERQARDAKALEDVTALDWALWVASFVTWDDIKDIAAWAATEGRDEAWELLEWYIKMLIMADAHQETNE